MGFIASKYIKIGGSGQKYKSLFPVLHFTYAIGKIAITIRKPISIVSPSVDNAILSASNDM